MNAAAVTDFKGIHAGRRVFIMASGPSLSRLDLSKLARRMVIGLNRSFLVYPETHYHCTMDQRLFDEFPTQMAATRYLFTLEGRPYGIRLPLLGVDGFSFDLTRGIYSGYTVTYFALQVAVYLGFSEIFLLGLDLKHAPGRTHFFGWDFHSENHESTEFPKMHRMLAHGAEVLRTAGVAVYNCSPDSAVGCFPYLAFDEAVAR